MSDEEIAYSLALKQVKTVLQTYFSGQSAIEFADRTLTTDEIATLVYNKWKDRFLSEARNGHA